MQGMRFLMVGQDGVPVNHGVIAQQLTAEHYVCNFAKTPAVSRVVRLAEIETWNLFPTDDAMNSFISHLTAKAIMEKDSAEE